jgi:hypothetical protein
MDVDCGWVVQRTNFFEDLVGYVSLIVFPAFRSVVQDIVDLDSVAFGFKFFPQYDVFFRFVGKEENQFHFLIFHPCNLHHGLEDGSDATAPSHEKDSLGFKGVVIFINLGIPMVTMPPAL